VVPTERERGKAGEHVEDVATTPRIMEVAASRLVQVDYELVAVGKYVTTQSGMDKIGSQPHVISDVEASHQRSLGSDCENKLTKQPGKVKTPISDNVAINQIKFNF
jgi:hypothetical protein